jgi:hypothetical protein
MVEAYLKERDQRWEQLALTYAKSHPPAGVDLTQVPGINPLTARVLLTKVRTAKPGSLGQPIRILERPKYLSK